MKPFRDDGALKPIGFALSAVMAGLAAGQTSGQAPAPQIETARVSAFAPDASLDPNRDFGHDEDASLILGASTPVEPFADLQEDAEAAFDL